MLLKIQNFVCLRNVEIEISDLTIIIGEQASGKSVTSKVYFFMREVISRELTDWIVESTGVREFQSELKKNFSVIFPEYSWIDSDFKISLADDDGDILIDIINSPNGVGLKFLFSDKFKQGQKRIAKLFKALKSEQEEIRNASASAPLHGEEVSEARLYFDAIRQTQSKNFFENVIYIPSGRSFFSTIKNNVFGFLSENIGIDPFLKNFGKNYENAKRFSSIREKRNKNSLARFDKISSSILKGTFVADKKDDWIVSDSRTMAVSHASSGQQEALPLLLVLRNLIDKSSILREQAVVIEEPEAHLFPVSQKAVVELIFLIKELRADAKLLITTHSPYVLSCVNNGILKSNNGVKVNAYFIANGLSTPIIDADTGLINGEELDKISGEISDEFYAAMEQVAK